LFYGEVAFHGFGFLPVSPHRTSRCGRLRSSSPSAAAQGWR
jgi:hypothetical protein